MSHVCACLSSSWASSSWWLYLTIISVYSWSYKELCIHTYIKHHCLRAGHISIMCSLLHEISQLDASNETYMYTCVGLMFFQICCILLIQTNQFVQRWPGLKLCKIFSCACCLTLYLDVRPTVMWLNLSVHKPLHMFKWASPISTQTTCMHALSLSAFHVGRHLGYIVP